MSERLLIAGASGLVGGELSLQAEARGWKTLGGARTVRGRAEIALELGDADGVRRTIDRFEPTVIALAAGFNWVDGCEREPEKSRRENVETVRNVVHAIRGRAIGLVSYSTDHVFDGTQNPYGESAKANPLSVYAWHKLTAEAAAAEHAPHLIVRTAWVFGDELQNKNFVAQVINAARNKQPMVLPRAQAGSPTWSRWLARSTLDAYAEGTRGVLHLVGPESHTKVEWARRIAQTLALPELELREVDPAASGQSAPRPERVVLKSERSRRVHPPLDEALKSLEVR